MAEQGLVTSFLDSFTRVSELERERKRDKQMAVQQAVDNALRQHQQEIQQKQLEQTAQFHADTVKHWDDEAKAAKAKGDLEAQKAAEKAKVDAENARRNAEREAATRRGAALKSFKAGSSRRESMIEAGYTDPEIQGELGRVAQGRAPEVERQNQLSQIGNVVSGLFGGGKSPLKPLPTPEAVGAEKSPEFLAKAKVEAERAAHLEALTKTLEESLGAHVASLTADAALKKSRTDLANIQASLAPKIAKLNEKRFQWQQIFQQGELNLRSLEVKVRQMEAYARVNDINGRSAKQQVQPVVDMLDGVESEYSKHLEKVKSDARAKEQDIKEARARLDYYDKVAKSAGGFAQLDPKVQSGMRNDAATIEGNKANLKELYRESEKYQALVNGVRQQKLKVQGINQYKVTGSGGLTPYEVKALEESQTRNQARGKLGGPKVKKLTADVATDFLKRAGGNRQRAKQLAAEAGYR